MHVNVPRLQQHEREQLFTSSKPTSESSENTRARVIAARQVQLARTGKTNACLTQAEIRKYCALKSEDEDYLRQAMLKLKLSTRGFFRILKMARTIADLAGADPIAREHLLEAISYRCPHRLE